MSFLQIPIGTYPNTFLGYQSSIGITTGTGDTAFGYLTLNANTTGSDNSAFGSEALRFNVSGSRNTAGGAEALQINNANNNTAFGYASQRGNVTGQDNSSFGHDSMRAGDDGNENSAFGSGALYNAANTQGNSGFGYLSLYNVTSGLKNSAFGWASGYLITTGSKNSILGSYSGNQGGLDIRTLSNYIVLSDGDGNPRLWIDNTGAVNIPGGFVLPGGTANGVLYLNGSKVVTSGSALTFDNTTSRFSVDTNGTGGSLRILAYGALVGEIRTPVPYTSLYFNVPSGNTYDWTFNNADAMRLTSTGLGIGTSNPQRKLHIVSAAPLRMGQSADYFEFSQSAVNLWAWISDSSKIALSMNGANGSVILNDSAIATNATGGFLYVAGCAGTPTGTPTSFTGRVPIVVDTTNNKLYFYSGGAWRDAGP